MEIIWHILLTVCVGSTCLDQDVQWFDKKEQCFESMELYKAVPPDGEWDTIKYICKPVGSVSS